ncbi:hypothetical protein BD309DRAFT_966302 [Dichomitus squalens]|uniref:Uncharacterized protein n=2 Tax=Dichomitus squalens TaxID=114155 RepID=A0A4Q9NJF9_9APHY|nr:uncharacterized protein DICSQDRAFT_170733 [Dichomitus squalens LYAD-421 SS1]EJF60873.1 hypothetical protein DICSQDRAFT_170733 [Dichomitus squalens LYAD-421 SS1]TBU26426.1 hypothetical protein BD311DRAFT_762609 [Dichomitus squalens]TBU40958.1 hypothetical protein BD309DRAFT_966302 [Dichomitus squalens]TBU53279.1 hypothetical protein BD310DRAFT_938450 [Dichomitus squalens]
MPSVTAQMQTLSLDEAPATPRQQHSDRSGGTAEPHTQNKSSRRSSRRRPRRVSPYPLPPREECLEAKSRGKCMCFGFYADAGTFQKAMISRFPDQLKDRDPYDMTLLWSTVLYLRRIIGCADLDLHIGTVSQRVKDQIPSIEDDVGESVMIVGLFPLDVEAYERRITQEGADEISRFVGMPPTWWEAKLLC